jgi:hypothetical protein
MQDHGPTTPSRGGVGTWDQFGWKVGIADLLATWFAIREVAIFAEKNRDFLTDVEIFRFPPHGSLYAPHFGRRFCASIWLPSIEVVGQASNRDVFRSSPDACAFTVREIYDRRITRH